MQARNSLEDFYMLLHHILYIVCLYGCSSCKFFCIGVYTVLYGGVLLPGPVALTPLRDLSPMAMTAPASCESDLAWVATAMLLLPTGEEAYSTTVFYTLWPRISIHYWTVIYAFCSCFWLLDAGYRDGCPA